jgi:hypothetical protein
MAKRQAPTAANPTNTPAAIDRPLLLGREVVRTEAHCTTLRELNRGECGGSLWVIAEGERRTEREATPFCHLHGYQD